MCPVDKSCLQICNAAHQKPDGSIWCAAIELGHGVCLWDPREWARKVQELGQNESRSKRKGS